MSNVTARVRFREFIADILAPRACVGCAGEGEWLCGPCGERVTEVVDAICVGCERLSPNGETCERCRPELPLHGVVAAAPYSDAIVQSLIHTVKYAPAADAASAFAFLVERCHRRGALRGIAREGIPLRVVPVPLHWRRLFSRGFNQADAIADSLARTLPATVVHALDRVRSTEPQVELPHERRGENVRDAFRCVQPELVAGRDVVLVDDVVTTGATFAACARALRTAGVERIWGFAIARG